MHQEIATVLKLTSILQLTNRGNVTNENLKWTYKAIYTQSTSFEEITIEKNYRNTRKIK
jgi:hypothetical protein